MNLKPDSHIYFIGIGGIAMSATAGIAKELGFEVFGSDSKQIYDPAKSVLDVQGIPYFIGYDPQNFLSKQIDIFIASAGEDLNNPEIKYLRDNNIEIYSLSQLLYELSQDKLRVVVSGTHGKSTTTAILGKCLEEIDDSSFMTGAVLQKEDRNYHNGDGHYFVFEGDEYKALFDDPTPKFHQYKADIVLLTNLEYDHPDVFSSLEEIHEEFFEMLDKMPEDGLIVYNSDSAELQKLIHRTNLGSVSFGIDNPGDFQVSSFAIHDDQTIFTVKNKDLEETYSLSVFGKMNVYNALGVVALLRTLGFSQEQVQHGLHEYPGIKRRFEYIGEFNGAKLFDDYAHHPTAVSETLAAARLRFPDKNIWAVFEPHTYSRTQAVLPELAKSFVDADLVLISEIYPARETKSIHSITGQTVIEAVLPNQPNAKLVHDKLEAKTILADNLNSDDVLIVMAVGNFNTLAKELANKGHAD